MAELAFHLESTFVTLTSDEGHIDRTEDGRTTLTKAPLQKAIKRLRYYAEKLYGMDVRYVAVGEYGSRTHRAHYHLILFGISPEKAHYLLSLVWKNGHFKCDYVNAQRVGYICKDIIKTMYQADDPRLEGREPPFRLWSLKPAIGAPLVDAVVDSYRKVPGNRHSLARLGDIREQFRFDGKTYIFDRWLKHKIRERLGIPVLARDRNTPSKGLRKRMTPEEASAHNERLKRRHSRRGVL